MVSTVRRNLERYGELFARAEASAHYWSEAAAHELIAELESRMARQGVSRAELARRLGTSKAYVTKVFSANVNFTLATMARLAQALDAEVHIRLTDRGATKRRRGGRGKKEQPPPADG